MEKRDNTNFIGQRFGKKFILVLPDKLAADFMIKSYHDSIPIRKFFRLLVEGYLADDKRLISYLEQAVREIRPKYQTTLLAKERVDIREIEREFGLDPNEIEDIYDILEEEDDEFR